MAFSSLYCSMDDVRKFGRKFKDLNLACDVITFGDPYYQKSKVFECLIESANNKGNMCGHCKSLAHVFSIPDEIGYVNGNWMAKRIRKNLKDGIAAWAPILPTKGCGIYEQKTVTLVRQRDYIIKCFDAAKGYYGVKDFAAHRDFKNEDLPTMSYLGYQTSGKNYGYGPEAVFECSIRFCLIPRDNDDPSPLNCLRGAFGLTYPNDSKAPRDEALRFLKILIVHLMRFLALGWNLEEIHVTWAHLEKKQTRLQTYTKSLKELCIQRVETASQA
ncbi:hypothetical protein Tco_1055504 [Tanacetum coccineum]|uniref:Uncharacterized protein n=1 Tax=Tanacetum coccineum TaxID=301880 RepID=A0ABQ5H1N3_9ASTR